MARGSVLFVSRQILEDFAGTLSFRSEAGRGSTFFVRIPLERLESVDSVSDLQSPPAAGLASALSSAEES